MTNLTASPSWDSVPQLEITDRNLGGPGGPLNLPLQALLNRTEFLGGSQGTSKVSGTWFGGAVTTVAALATVAGASLMGYSAAAVGSVARSVQDRLRDSMSVADYITPSTADVAGNFVYVPAAGATMGDRASGAALTASYMGPGRITTADGNVRARFFSTLTTAPTLGNHNGIDTAFNGSGPSWSYEHRITGAATLGQPGTGFVWVPEACGIYGIIRNASGWNQSNVGNDGRTAVSFLRMKAFHAGKGGTNLMSGTIVLSGNDDPANTSFLANAAGCVYTGDYFCTVDGQYMDGFEIQFHDQTHDCAAAAHVYNFDRNNNTGAKGAWWVGFRGQSIGSKPVDALISASGKFDRGIDLSFMDFSASSLTNANGAIVLSAGQRIYLNGNKSDTTGLSRFSADPNTTYIMYSSGSSSIALVAGNNSSLQVGSGTVITTVTTHLAHGASDYLAVAGVAGAPTVTAAGTSTDVGITHITKGAGTHSFQTAGGVKQFEVIDTASAVNYIQATGSATTFAVAMSAIGTDSNINFRFSAKGTGLVLFATNGANQVSINGPASAVNQVQLQGSATTGPVSVSAVGTATDLDLTLTPKGAGMVRFGTYTTKAAEAFAGYVSMKDAGGTTRKVMVCA